MDMRATSGIRAACAGLLALPMLVSGAHSQSAVVPSAPAPVAQRAPASGSRGQALQDRQEERIAALRRQLKITPAQEAQWNAFTGVMHDNMAHMRAVYAQNADTGQHTALDDMRAYAEITTAHAEDVQKLVPAFAALYAAMSPEQQKTADAVFHQYAQRAGQATTGR